MKKTLFIINLSLRAYTGVIVVSRNKTIPLFVYLVFVVFSFIPPCMIYLIYLRIIYILLIKIWIQKTPEKNKNWHWRVSSRAVTAWGVHRRNLITHLYSNNTGKDEILGSDCPSFAQLVNIHPSGEWDAERLCTEDCVFL